MTQAIIWFLLGYVSGGVVGLLVMAVVAANKEKEDGTTVDAVPVVRCAYCDPGSQDYNPCWLCKKGGTAHDVEHCHETNYGDYEPMQPHCHLCGRKL